MRTPFSEPSTLPYGLPPFAEIDDEHYEPAFEQGFAEQLAELAEITASEEEPSFENTVVALERSGRLLARVQAAFSTRTAADSTPFVTELDQRMSPRLAAHEDALRLDARLYSRICRLWENVDALGLDDEQRYLLQRHHTVMTLAGAGLDEERKARLRELNERLSTLTTRFEKNLLAETNDLAVHFSDAAELDGLTAGQLSAAAEAARGRGLPGHLVTLVLPTGHPYLESLTVRESRERIMAASRARGRRGNEHDNRPLVLEITRLRAERAALLGFDTHAAFVTADQTAGSPQAVADMLGGLAGPAARNAVAEQEELQRMLGKEPLQAHDWPFYRERVRTQRHDVDTAALRPYLESERVLQDGVFFAASRLYGITFTERGDLVGYHPDVRVFEVHEEDGTGLGLFLLDLYTRDTKRGGAWMNSLTSRIGLLGQQPVVINNLNVPKPAPGEPTLLTYDEVRTLFHEFGHALHGLFASVTYPSTAGTRVHRDFVEFPSQVNEMWMLWPEVLANYAVHHLTGEPIDGALIDRLEAAQRYGEGFATSEYLAAALLDQAWHAIDAEADVRDADAFESLALSAVGLDNPAVPPRYSSSYFAHVFSGGYDAGYYSYIWSEVLDADTVEWFRENGGLTRSNGDRFRRRVLAVGGSRDPLEAYRDFRGRDALLQPLLERRGLS